MVVLEAAKQIADQVITSLADDKPPAYFQQLEGVLNNPPTELYELAEVVANPAAGVREGLARLVADNDDSLVVLPEKIEHILSGARENVNLCKSTEVQEFFRNLFEFIAATSPVTVKLCGWDLYHAHLFAVPSSKDLGLLFHAREHPEEFTMSKTKIYPIGHNHAGGDLDPRMGTQYSIDDPQFPLRNYLWTLKSNKVWLIDPTKESFPRELIQMGGERFYTVDAGCFGSGDLANVNYFPPSHPIFVIPTGGTPPETHLGRALNRIDNLSTASKEAMSNMIEKEIGSLDVSELEDLAHLMCRQDVCTARVGRLPKVVHEVVQASVSSELERAKQREDSSMRQGEASLMARVTAVHGACDDVARDESSDIRKAVKLCGGNAYRAECLLQVANHRYRSEEQKATTTRSWPLDVAFRVLYGVDPTGGDIDLALQTLRAIDEHDGITEAIDQVARNQWFNFAQDCNARFDKLLREWRASKITPEFESKPSIDSVTSPTGGGVRCIETLGDIGQRSGIAPLEYDALRPEPRTAAELADRMIEIASTSAKEGSDTHDPPKCCEVHRMLHRERHSPRHLTGLQEACLKQLRAEGTGGRAWVVLVGGETGSTMHRDKAGTRPGKYLGSHTSLQEIGRAYAQLVPYVGRQNIIVMVQLEETLTWLRQATASEAACAELAGKVSVLGALRARLKATESDCEKLLKDGGADYDGDRVNPTQLLNVLRGQATRQGDKVVPPQGVSTVTLIIASHGNAHAAHETSSRDEWYCHFPYPSPESEEHLYHVVSHTGLPDPKDDESWSAPRYRYRLYSTMLFQVYHEMLQRSPFRRLVVLYQFCLSGGAANFMQLAPYRQYFGTHTWPMYVMTTSGEYEPALGAFLMLWLKELKNALHDGSKVSLEQLFSKVKAIYWEEVYPEVAEYNKSNPHHSIGAEDPKNPRTMGTIKTFSGQDTHLGVSMDEIDISTLTNQKSAMSNIVGSTKASDSNCRL